MTEEKKRNRNIMELNEPLWKTEGSEEEDEVGRRHVQVDVFHIDQHCKPESPKKKQD
jgi:hypothetical protein